MIARIPTRIGQIFRQSLHFSNAEVCSSFQRTRHAICGIGRVNTSSENENSYFWTSRRFYSISLAVAASCWFSSYVDSCGIVGIVGADDASEFLLDGLQIVKNRGYDSAGIASLSPSGEIVVTKYASKHSTADSIDLVRENSAKHKGHHIGIAHTRWATHGGKTDKNAHPHMDYRNRIAVIHNGTINNSFELKKEIESKSPEITYQSETDTEVIANLIGLYLDIHEEKQKLAFPNHPEPLTSLVVKDAVTKALRHCEGTWGLAVICKDEPNSIIVACNGASLLVGLSMDQVNGSQQVRKTYIASEAAVFSHYTTNYIALKDGEIGIVNAQGTSLDLSRIESIVDPDDVLSLPSSSSSGKNISPAPFPHWTLRECYEQPESIARALDYGGRMFGDKVMLGGLDKELETLNGIRHLVLTGCGTSLYACQFAAKLMKDLASFETVLAMDSAEIRHPTSLPPPKSRNGGLLAVSQSGETKDVHRALVLSAQEGIPTFSVVNVVGSLISRTTGLGVYLKAGRENAVASTKAFSSQVTVLTLIALWFQQLRWDMNDKAIPGVDASFAQFARPGISGLRRRLFDSLHRLPITFGMAIKGTFQKSNSSGKLINLREKCREIASDLISAQHCFILGKGYCEPIAMEGALKIKEIGYLHAEGFNGSALKHGPFALLEDSTGTFGATPVIMIILDDDHATSMRIAAQEVKSRGTKITIITDNAALAEGIDPCPVIIPNNGPLTALLAVLPLQLIAYELSVLKGINPDVPRNLAKAITVD